MSGFCTVSLVAGAIMVAQAPFVSDKRGLLFTLVGFVLVVIGFAGLVRMIA
jgi:hypothetical protein